MSDPSARLSPERSGASPWARFRRRTAGIAGLCFVAAVVGGPLGRTVGPFPTDDATGRLVAQVCAYALVLAVLYVLFPDRAFEREPVRDHRPEHAPPAAAGSGDDPPPSAAR